MKISLFAIAVHLLKLIINFARSATNFVNHKIYVVKLNNNNNNNFKIHHNNNCNSNNKFNKKINNAK